MCIGENPGFNEDMQDECWVGQAGQLLDGALRAAGIPVAFLTNVTRCAKGGRRSASRT